MHYGAVDQQISCLKEFKFYSCKYLGWWRWGPFCYELDASRAKILYIQLHQIFVVMILALVNFVLM